MDEVIPMIIVFGFVTLMVKMGIQHNQKKLSLKSNAENSDAVNVELQKEISELKERISVLEKIVTNDKYDLKKEFDKLDVA